jgi:hypothetical protein
MPYPQFDSHRRPVELPKFEPPQFMWYDPIACVGAWVVISGIIFLASGSLDLWKIAIPFVVVLFVYFLLTGGARPEIQKAAWQQSSRPALAAAYESTAPVEFVILTNVPLASGGLEVHYLDGDEIRKIHIPNGCWTRTDQLERTMLVYWEDPTEGLYRLDPDDGPFAMRLGAMFVLPQTLKIPDEVRAALLK